MNTLSTIKKNWILLFSLPLFFTQSDAATFTSNVVVSGNWNDPASWTVGGVDADGIPDADDDVSIVAGDKITMNDGGAALSITIDGTAEWLSAYSTNIGSGGIIFNAGGDITGAVNGILTTKGGLTMNGVTLTSTTVTIEIKTTAGQTFTGTGTLAKLGIYPPADLTNNGTLTITSTLTGTGSFTNGAGASLTFSGASIILTTLTATAAGNTVTYNVAAGTQSIKATNYNNLTLSNATLKYFRAGTTSIAGTLSITAGSVDATSYSTIINYNGSGAQTVVSSFTYYDLTINKSGGTATLASNTTVNRNLTITAGTLDASTFTCTVKGNWSNSGIFTASTSSVKLNGSAAQSITGSTSFNNLQIWNSAGVSINDDITINGVLTLTSGNLTAASDTVIVSSTGSVSRSSGHIVGYMRKTITAGSPSKTYEVGSGSNYTPVVVTFTGVGADVYLTASTTGSDHASIGTSTINSALSVNRYWSLINTGITFTDYSAVFYFVSGDKDVGLNTDALTGERYDGASWSTESVGTRASTNTQLTALTLGGDFQLGETSSSSLYSRGTGNWSTTSNWSFTEGGPSCNCIPQSSSNVVIVGGHNVTMDITGNALSLTIQGIATWSSAYTTNVGTGGIDIQVGGDIQGASNGILTSTGGLTINAILTSTTVTIELKTTVAQSISGTGTLAKLGIYAPAVATNTGTLSVTSNLLGNGTFINGAGTTLNYTGTTVNITTLTATAGGNTVNYNSGAGSQNIFVTDYDNLTLSNAAVKYFRAGTTGIAATLSVAGGSVNTSSYSTTISFNGGGAQTVPNSFSYYNLTLDGSGTKTFAAGTTTIGGASFTMSGSAAADATANSATIQFTRSGNQTIGAINYYNLTLSGTGTKTFSAGTSGIANTFTIAGSVSATDATTNSTTIDYNGGGAQTVKNINYYNLTLSNAGVKTLSSGTTGIANTLTISGTATADATTNSTTIDFNKGGAQTINAINYYNLTLSVSGVKTFATGTTGIGNTLTLSGTASADATTNTTTINFNKAGAQSVNAIAYNSLTISGSGTKTLAGGSSITDVLTISAGTFNMNGQAFTVKSSAPKTAQVAEITGTLSLATNVTVERYIAGPDSGSREIGPAISGRTVNDWSDDFTIDYAPWPNWPNVNSYNPVTAAWSGLASGASITPGKGYDAYIYDGELPRTLDLTGTLVQGNVDVALSVGTDTYNLVSNPYACDIDIEDADWSWGPTTNEVSVWDDAIYDYRYYTRGLGPGAPAGSRYIASGQAFWVNTAIGATLGFREGIKAPAASATFYKTNPGLNDALVINMGGNNYATSTALRFRNDATEAYDAELDASKRTSPDKRAVAYLASISGDDKTLASNCLPEIKGNVSIPLLAKAHKEGVYSFSLSNIPSSVPSFAKIMLEDLAKGTMTEMKKNSAYSFSLDGNFDNNSPRFVLHIITYPSASIKSSSTEGVRIYSYDNKAHLLFSFAEDTDVSVDIFNLLGQKAGTTQHHRVKNQTIVMDLPASGNGIYLVSITTPGGIVTKKIQAGR